MNGVPATIYAIGFPDVMCKGVGQTSCRRTTMTPRIQLLKVQLYFLEAFQRRRQQ
jgi:hypothetical protein